MTERAYLQSPEFLPELVMLQGGDSGDSQPLSAPTASRELAARVEAAIEQAYAAGKPTFLRVVELASGEQVLDLSSVAPSS